MTDSQTTVTPPSGARFTVTPATLVVGRPVTFSGTACSSADIVLVNVSTPPDSPGTAAQITADARGTWKTTVTAADATLLGPQTATAICARRVDHAIVFAYPPVPVTVTTFRRIIVSRTTARAGTDVRVVAKGPCPSSLNNDGDVALMRPNDTEFGGSWLNVEQFVSVDANGGWAITLHIPASIPPGAYKLVARCVYSRAFPAWYPTVPITVTR